MLGIIDYLNEGTTGVITAPTTALVDEEFVVTISTFLGGCDRVGDTQVDSDGITATITVYDHFALGGSCTSELVRAAHTATLHFDQPGTVTLRVQGRQLSDTMLNEGSLIMLNESKPITIEQQIVVK
jgi:hypothetical protein